MDDQLNKERNHEFTVLSVITAVLLFIMALFVSLASSNEADFSVSGIKWLFKNDPGFWLVAVFTVLFPLGIYIISRKLTKRIREKQRMIDELHSRVEHVKEFTEQLIHGNFEVNCQLDESDTLGDSLVNLRETLKTNDENSIKLRKAEEERNWIAEGMGHFSETLRNYIHEPEQLSFHIIKDLTKYVNAIQGGFYILEDEDSQNPYFNLTAFFAYDRKKFADQKIKWGDGLIGTCALEKKTIYLKNVPEEYITVTSGLGDARPDSLIVVPMIYEDKIYGVMEFASFNRFEPNQITLIEKTAESVGATLAAIKTNVTTARLLEESKQQTQILTSHEEEMRQNMEELQATQEESIRQNQRLVLLEETLKQNILLAEIDAQGIITTGNSMLHSKLEYGGDLRIEGKNFSSLIDENYREWFENIWQQIITENKPFRGFMKLVTRTGKELWIMASMSNTLYEDQSVAKVMLLGIDSTLERNLMKKQEAVLLSISNTGIHTEFDINGNLQSWNPGFTELFGMEQKDLKTMVIFDLIHPNDLDAFNKKWEALIHGTAFTGIIRAKNQKGEELWISGSFNVSENAAHEIDRVVFAGFDITREKNLESEVHRMTETLKKLEKQIKEAEKEQVNKLRDVKAEMTAMYKEVDKVRNLHEKMIEDMADAIVITGHDNRIKTFNKAAEKLWDINRQEVIGHDIGVLFPESVVEKDEVLASFIHPGNHKITGSRKKSTIVDKKGKQKLVLVLLTKARSENENAYMGVFQSLTP